MTVEQRIIWTTLPNGVSTRFGQYRFSVLVSPRLRTDEGGSRPTLQLFPDFLDWPGRAVRFRLAVDGAPVVEARRVGSVQPDSQLWKRLFPSTTFVRPHRFTDLSDHAVRAYSPAVLERFTRDVFTGVLRGQPTAPPSIAEVLPRLAPMARAESSPRVYSRYSSLLGTKPSIRAQRTATIQNLLTKQRAVPHRADPLDQNIMRTALADVATADGVVESFPEVPDIDFHQTIGLLGSHPEILRRLGLIIDLEASVADVGPIDDPVSIRIIPDWTSKLASRPGSTRRSVDVTPATRTTTSENRFEARPRAGSNLASRHVAVGRPDQFQSVGLDADAAAAVLELHTETLIRDVDTVGEGRRYALPTLRTGGLQVVEVARALRTRLGIVRRKELNDLFEQGVEAQLFADDLARGFRPDVWIEDEGKWCSLVARSVTYELTDGSSIQLDDEAIVSAAVTAPASRSTKDLLMNETILTWRGWSLAAPRPGLPVSKDEFPGPDGFPDPKNTAAAGVPIEITAKVRPGTLPRLRFGKRYRLRLRSVDLAGNSVALDSGAPAVDSEITTALVTHRRFEAVPSPAAVHRKPRTQTETNERLVVRSSDFDGPGENTELSSRHLVLPKTSQIMAEEHGMYDVDAGGQAPLRVSAYADIVARESQSLDPLTTVDPNDPNDSYIDQNSVPPPYLPDPLARGVSVVGLPGRSSDDPLLQRLGDDQSWPDYGALRLDLSKADGDDGYTERPDALNVQLAAGSSRSIRIGCFVDEADLDLLALFGWFEGEPDVDPVALEQLRTAATRGLVHTLTPSRRYTLVHAVRQPATAPSHFGTFARARSAGDTFARISGNALFHAASTGKLDLIASWSEPVDRGPGTPVPTTREVRRASVGTVPQDQVDAAGQFGVTMDIRHDFLDTKRRRVDYRLVATSRYVEEFRKRTTAVFPAADSTVTLPDLGHGVIASSVNVRSLDGSSAYRPDVDFRVEGDGTTVRSVTGGGLPLGTQVAVDYVAAPITRESGDRQVDVPSSARPAAPVVRDVVPAFQWSRSSRRGIGKIPNSVTSSKKGNTLRIHLERPWFSSGEGELLGVVVPRAFSGGLPSPAMAPFVTLWGQDPTVDSPGLPGRVPTAGDFPAAEQLRVNSSLPGAPDLVDVAGHAVAYDEEREIWYSDIVIDPGIAYQPFVRLSLVRFQPNSVTDLHLSSAVPVSIMQLTADRTLTVLQGGNDRTYDLILTGIFSGPRLGLSARDVVRVTVEEKTRPAAGDAGWVSRSSSTLTYKSLNRRYEGRSVLPSSPTPGRYRLVVEQFERIETQDHPGEDSAFGERLVHLDTVSLPI